MGKKRPAATSAGITDPRFTQITTDPRFRTAPTHVQQFEADERFSSMFSDTAFQGPTAPKVDARGKPVTSVKNPLAKLYARKDGQGCLDEDGRFKWEAVSSSEEEADQSPDISEDPAEDVWMEAPPAPEGAATSRIAVQSLDWAGITAVDLLALFRSFCPESGSVLSVSIYPSQYGHEQLELESANGPTAEIFDSKQEGGLDEVKLRKYEKDRMKYYFAVAVCDSVATADAIYQACEGLEIERTSNVLDMRFVPDSLMEFPYPAKEVAESVPKAYSLKDFFSRSLQHSRVKLTWDETPLERTQTLKKTFTEEELEKMDLNEYLASPSSEEEEESGQEAEPAEVDASFKKESQFSKQRKDDVDLEITFNTAFDEMADQAKAPKAESAWERHEQKRKKTHSQKLKEKSKAKKLSKKETATLSLLVNTDEQQYQFNPEDNRFATVFSDPTFAVDPTHPRFKRDAQANEKMLEVQRKKRKLEE